MANGHALVKEQLLHMLFGTITFVILGAIAVGLDLAAAWIARLGVSPFTHTAIEIAAHGLLTIDLLLFALYTAKSSLGLVKEMLK